MPAGLALDDAGGARDAGSRSGRAEGDLAHRDGTLCWGGEPLMAAAEIRLRGAHNRENAMAAAAVCLARGVDAGAVREGLATFAGVAHRLEEIAVVDGVTLRQRLQGDQRRLGGGRHPRPSSAACT